MITCPFLHLNGSTSVMFVPLVLLLSLEVWCCFFIFVSFLFCLSKTLGDWTKRFSFDIVYVFHLFVRSVGVIFWFFLLRFAILCWMSNNIKMVDTIFFFFCCCCFVYSLFRSILLALRLTCKYDLAAKIYIHSTVAIEAFYRCFQRIPYSIYATFISRRCVCAICDGVTCVCIKYWMGNFSLPQIWIDNNGLFISAKWSARWSFRERDLGHTCQNQRVIPWWMTNGPIALLKMSKNRMRRGYIK